MGLHKTVTKLHREQTRARKATYNNTVNAAFIKRLHKLEDELVQNNGEDWIQSVTLIKVRNNNDDYYYVDSENVRN